MALLSAKTGEKSNKVRVAARKNILSKNCDYLSKVYK